MQLISKARIARKLLLSKSFFVFSYSKQALADRLLSKLTERCRYSNKKKKTPYDFCQRHVNCRQTVIIQDRTDEEHELRVNRKTNLIIYLFAFTISFHFIYRFLFGQIVNSYGIKRKLQKCLQLG